MMRKKFANNASERSNRRERGPSAEISLKVELIKSLNIVAYVGNPMVEFGAYGGIP
jgi:hypothetical protein